MALDSLYGYDKCRWGITFLEADMTVSFEDKAHLIFQATEMYLCEQPERDVATDTLEGRIWTKGDYQLLGSFGGVQYRAEVETERGKSKIRFLVCEKIRANLN